MAHELIREHNGISDGVSVHVYNLHEDCRLYLCGHSISLPINLQCHAVSSQMHPNQLTLPLN